MNKRMPEPGKFLVAEKMCRECLFTKNRVVDEDRAQELIDQCKADGSYFVCHKGSLTGNDQLCCRGFFDQVPTQVIGLAKALKVVKFVPVPEAPSLKERL